MAVYEAPEYLDQAIGSVLAQTFTDFELIVQDDGSKRPEVAAILDRAIEDPRVFVWHHYPSSAERAATVRYATLLNDAALDARGEFLTFLCGDDYFMPDRLERMVGLLDERSAYRNVVYGTQRMLFEDGTEALRPTFGPLDDAYHRVDLNSVMVTRSAFMLVGGFPDTPAAPQMWREADAHLWRKLTREGFRFHHIGGEPSDVKRYRTDGVDERVKAGLTPWMTA